MTKNVFCMHAYLERWKSQHFEQIPCKTLYSTCSLWYTPKGKHLVNRMNISWKGKWEILLTYKTLLKMKHLHIMIKYFISINVFKVHLLQRYKKHLDIYIWSKIEVAVWSGTRLFDPRMKSKQTLNTETNSKDMIRLLLGDQTVHVYANCSDPAGQRFNY